MQGIEIKDSTLGSNFLSFDLREILAAIGNSALASSWRCQYVECTGDNAEVLHRISDEGRVISGVELVQIVSGIHQTIDGKFQAYRDKANNPWLIIRAVDSTSFDVLSSDSKTLEKMRRNFRDVTDLPSDAA
jgi:hypothetical protein